MGFSGILVIEKREDSMITFKDKIKKLRKEKKLTQQDIADQIGVSRTTYIMIENGDREITVNEMNKLSFALGVSFDELLYDTHKIQSNDFGLEKYKQILLNCLKYGGDSNDGKITKTKLAKLSYLVDFGWFYKHLESMSGLIYRRIQQGPVPDQYFRAIDELFDEKSIKIEQKGAAFLISPIENPSINLLDDKELSFIKLISKKWKNKNTNEIVRFTHKQLPWKICREGEFIPYELITQEDPGNVY